MVTGSATLCSENSYPATSIIYDPTRQWTYSEFADRYCLLVHSKSRDAQREVKDLCLMILEIMIKGVNKSKGGIAENFFCAAMLACLEAQRSEKLNSHVTLLQRNIRRWLGLTRFRRVKSAITMIQKCWRGAIARKVVGRIREDLASCRFQRAARRFVQRKVFLDTRDSIVHFQSIIRGQNSRKKFTRMRLEAAAVQLQSFCRGILTRRTYKAEITSVVWIQSHIRRRNACAAVKPKAVLRRLEVQVAHLTQMLEQARVKSGADVESKLQLALAKVIEQEAQIKRLNAELQSVAPKFNIFANEEATTLGSPSRQEPQFSNPLTLPSTSPPGPEDAQDNSEELVKLLLTLDELDQEVHKGLIIGLQIPSPTLASAPNLKEVFFPANLIAMTSHGMWKHGMIKESTQFLTNTMQAIQTHSFTEEDAIVPGAFWLSNVHEILSFVCCVEDNATQGVGEVGNTPGFGWLADSDLTRVLKADLESLESSIYHSWMAGVRKKLARMTIPALIECQSLPDFIAPESTVQDHGRLLEQNGTPLFNVDDILNVLNKVFGSLKCFFMWDIEVDDVISLAMTRLFRLIGTTSFNDLLMRKEIRSWKRVMQIQHNIAQLKEWCESHEVNEATLCLEHLAQATKLLQLKKATQVDIDIMYKICWLLTPSQIQRLCTNSFVTEDENPISPEILELVAQRVEPNDETDQLLLTPEDEKTVQYVLPLPREISCLEDYIPDYINAPVGHFPPTMCPNNNLEIVYPKDSILAQTL